MPRTAHVTDHLRDARDSLAESGRHGRRAGRAAIDSIEEEWARLRNELNELASDGVLAKNPELEALLERLRDGVAHAHEMIGETSRQTSHRIARAANNADDYVHEEPWKVASMAAIAGLAIGLLLSRR
ncbi:MAG: hypothetical protein WCZ28_03260 [Burkholderiaceae bacterium]